MATKYFDRNGSTTGFGVLTGAWDTTTASWTDSAAGTAIPAAYTFTDADDAQFGATGTSATAGTATIAASLNVTLNRIITQNLAAQQFIAAGAGGGLTFAGTLPTVDVRSNAIANTGSLRISAPIAGTAGLVLDHSAGTGVAILELTASSNGISTATNSINVASQNLFVHTGTGVATSAGVTSYSFPNVLDYDLTGGFRLGYFTSPQTLPAGTTFSGEGWLECFLNGSNLVTFPAGALAGLTGTRAGANSYTTSNVPQSGLALFCQANLPTATACEVAVNDLPTLVTFASWRQDTPAISARLYYIGAAATYANTRIELMARVASATAALTQELYANHASGALVIGGGIKRVSQSQAQTFTLRGTNTAANAINGAIEELGTLTIAKQDAGRWNLGGTSTYTGQTVITDGVLGATSAGALGASTGGLVRIEGTGVLELIGGITLNKSGTDFEIHPTNPIQSDGDNTVRTRGIALGGTVTFTVDSGDKLTIDNVNPITNATGTRGVTKAGAGELQLAATANTFNGFVTISAGTLTVSSMNNHNVAGVFGNSALSVALTGALKYVGSGAASTNKVQLVGATPTLEAAGAGAATFPTFAATDEARQLVLRGASTAANTVSAALANTATRVTGLKKQGAGRWVMTGALSYTGATDVEAGTLRVETSDSNTTSGAVTISAGAVVELVTDTLASVGATSGEVLGTGNVTVAGDIKTRGGTTQKGMARYGGNLTFQAGSKLYIGAAA